MDRNQVLTITSLAMIILGIAMVALGLLAGSKIMLPPVVTGIGFFFLAWALHALKK